MKKNSIKKMVASLVAIVICFAMLIGTTWAWFADSVTSSNNVIASGLLNVNAYWMEGKADPSVESNWTEFNGDPIFNYEKWEPGYVEAKHIKIVNEGSLAFKYNLYIIQEKGADSTLANVIDVYFLDKAQTITRDSITSARKVGTLADLIADPDGAARGILLPAGTTPNDPEKEMVGSVSVSIAFKMQETAGNEYQGLDLGKFDISIFATQYEFEEDTFDNAYDTGLTPIEDGDVFVEENGVQYVYNDEGAFLYLVTEDYAEETLVVPEGITNIGNYAFAYNSNVKEVVLSSTVTSLGRGFDSSTVEKVVLNEGLETIDSRAFRSTSALKEVVISSTVKTIADNAFQKSAIKTITIPATVETIGETAFGASLIEEVVFEGNTSIQGYAFRGCPALSKVVMNGDDVKFVPSTLNGRNSMWFCNGESNNPNTSNITFNVVNETVAARVKTAMGPEANNTPVYVNDSLFVTAKNVTELQNAVDNATAGDTIVFLTADITGNVTITQKEGVNLVISGNGKKFTGVMTTFGNGRQAGAETLTIKNVNFVAAAGAGSCIVSPDRSVNNKYSYSHNVTVEGCNFTDPDGVVDCAAIRHEDGGDKNLVVKNCTVDSTMHSLLQVNNVEGKLTIDGCTINSKNGLNLNSCTNIEITGCTFDTLGYNVRFGVNSGGNLGEAKACTIKNSTLKSACDDGDAAIIFRASAVDMVLTFENATITATTQISGNTVDTTINGLN